MRLRLVSWNIHSCVGSDGVYDPDRIAAVLADLDPDIIGLQEVDWRREPIAGVDQFQHLAATLGLTAVAGPNLVDHRGAYGNGLLTSLEIVDVVNVDLAFGSREPRGAIDALLRADGGRVRATVTHLGLTWRERRRQLRDLASHLTDNETGEDARVLLADLNDWRPPRLTRCPLHREHYALASTMRTFPARLPLFALDRIYLGPKPRSVEQVAVDSGEARRASDHLPIVVDVEWGGDADDV